MWEIAQEFDALLVFAEHRYYGESMPYGDRSFDKGRTGYLTSQQALADYVDLITYLRHNGSYASHRQKPLAVGNAYEDSDGMQPDADGKRTEWPGSHPVIAFGGSYGGMLAAWFRMKYPAIIEG